MIALLPPSSSNDFPNLFATAVPTALPIRVDPVAETRSTLVSLAIHSPASLCPTTRQLTPTGTLLISNTSAISFWHATAHSGVFSEGFQTQTLPQTHASVAFQLHTATGKLNADIIPTTPSGCHCSYILCPGRSLCM